ncbi:hypothetical protein [Streptomyces zaomyceticus]|uniref:hypothetical protein n=1 Tax=Streptomyces zaomyceticus TaxID=68286 RepID=UPI0034482A73
MTPPEPLPPLLPTQYHSPEERLLHGKGIAAAVGAGRAEDWAELDQNLAMDTWRPGPRWSRGTVRIGFHWFDTRELADWTTAPHWHETGPDGGPGGVAAWSSPPTESEIVLALCHADPLVRAAALRLAELPAAALPLVLIRCADTDGTVRELARAILSRALDGTDAATDEAVRALVPLALLLDLRRHGRWARETVLTRAARTDRDGEVVAEAVAELLTSRRYDVRRAGVRAAASWGLLDAAGAYATAERDTDVGVAGEAVRAAVRLSRRALEADGTAREQLLARFHAFMGLRRDPVLGRTALATALEEGLLGPEDLVRLAVAHPERIARRTALAALLDAHDPSPFLDELATARDAVVRAAAVERLRPAGRDDDLARHLTDSHAPVRALARRELRAAGVDPYPVYRALCTDPATVTPAAVSGLAGRRDPEDVPLFHELTRHALGAVRARALGVLRRLGSLPGDGPVAFADDPDRTVRKTVLRTVRRHPGALRVLLTAAHGDVRAAALDLLRSRHGLHWREAVPFLEDPAPSVTRVARATVGWNKYELPLSFLLDLAAPGRPHAQRAAGLALMHDDEARLLAALRLADDPDVTLRWRARRDAVRELRRLEEEVRGPYGDEIRRLVAHHAAELPGWQDEIRRRNRAARGR